MITAVQSRQAAHAAGQQEIADAEREHREATDLLAALQERVRASDPDVRPAELAEARELVEYARLRVDAAKRRAAQLAAEARHALYVEAGAVARALDLADAPVVDAFTAALAAVRHLYRVADDRTRDLLAIAGQADAALAEAKAHNERPALRAAGVHNADPRNVTVIHADGTAGRIGDVPAHELAFAVLARLFTEQARAVGPYVPWAGEDAARAEQGLRLAVAEFPALATAEQ